MTPTEWRTAWIVAHANKERLQGMLHEELKTSGSRRLEVLRSYEDKFKEAQLMTEALYERYEAVHGLAPPLMLCARCGFEVGGECRCGPPRS